MMLPHINKLCCFLHATKSGLHDNRRFTNEGDDCTVGCFTGINIQKFHAFHLFHHIGNLLDYFLVTPFAEVGDTFDDLFFSYHIIHVDLIFQTV